MIADDGRNRRTREKDCKARRDMQTGMQRSERVVNYGLYSASIG